MQVTLLCGSWMILVGFFDNYAIEIVRTQERRPSSLYSLYEPLEDETVARLRPNPGAANSTLKQVDLDRNRAALLRGTAELPRVFKTLSPLKLLGRNVDWSEWMSSILFMVCFLQYSSSTEIRL